MKSPFRADFAATAWTCLPEGDPSWTATNDGGVLTRTVTVRIPMTDARLRFTQD